MAVSASTPDSKEFENSYQSMTLIWVDWLLPIKYVFTISKIH